MDDRQHGSVTPERLAAASAQNARLVAENQASAAALAARKAQDSALKAHGAAIDAEAYAVSAAADARTAWRLMWITFAMFVLNIAVSVIVAWVR